MEKLNCISVLFMRQVVSKSLIHTRKLTLSYKILGESTFHPPKPPIFIFHGLLGNKREWEAFGKTILTITHRTVVVVDLRNHGDSPHDNSHKFKDQAADVIHLLDKLGAKKVSLVGYSMGGRTAMCVALTAPQKVAGLLVVDISPHTTVPEYSETFTKVLAGMKEVNFKKYKKLSEAKPAVRMQMKQLFPNEYMVDSIVSNVRQKLNGTIGWACNLDVLIKDLKCIMTFPDDMQNKVYDGPTLFLGGQLSEYIPPDDLISIRKLFPRAVVIYIPNTHHHVHRDDPKTFLEIVISFVKTHTYSEAD